MVFVFFILMFVFFFNNYYFLKKQVSTRVLGDKKKDAEITLFLATSGMSTSAESRSPVLLHLPADSSVRSTLKLAIKQLNLKGR